MCQMSGSESSAVGSTGSWGVVRATSAPVAASGSTRTNRLRTGTHRFATSTNTSMIQETRPMDETSPRLSPPSTQMIC